MFLHIYRIPVCFGSGFVSLHMDLRIQILITDLSNVLVWSSDPDDDKSHLGGEDPALPPVIQDEPLCCQILRKIEELLRQMCYQIFNSVKDSRTEKLVEGMYWISYRIIRPFSMSEIPPQNWIWLPDILPDTRNGRISSRICMRLSIP